MVARPVRDNPSGFPMPKGRTPYVVSIVITVLAAFANAALWPELGSRYPLIAFFLAVAVSSWFGGFWPGALSTALSAIAGTYFWFAPQFRSPSHQGNVLVMILFVGIGLTMAFLAETLKRRTERAEQAERESVRLSKELRAADQKILEAEQSARREAERANRIKDEILSTVSHELRTPLGAILRWADILKSSLADDVNRGRALEGIRRSAEQQIHLLEELLDTARVKSGVVQLNYERVDLDRVARDAWNDVAPAADVKRIQTNIDIDATASTAPFYGDPARLHQIMENLFANAVKFTPFGGQVSTRVRQLDGSVEIVVADTGQGISEDFLPFVFEPFRQADASKVSPETGFGLGLFIVKQLVEAHRGDVRVTSDGEGRGATFTVRLPLEAGHGDGRKKNPSDRMM